MGELRSFIRCRTFPNCVPDDGMSQQIILDGNKLTMPYNPQEDRFLCLYSLTDSTYKRTVIMQITRTYAHDIIWSNFAPYLMLNKIAINFHAEDNFFL
jgi:hypothetical protein